MSELPTGWETSCLPAVLSPTGVFSDGDWVESKDQDPSGDVRLIQLADIGDGFYRNRSSRFLTSERAVELRCTFLETGDVLVARMPDPLGRACVFPGDAKRSVTVVDVCVVRPGNSGAVPNWLMHVVNSPQFRREIAKRSSGTTRKRISRKNLGRIELPVPPLNEQRRIVNKIEALNEHSRAAREALEQVPLLLERFRQSVLAAAFRGDLTAEWRAQNPDAEPASVLLKRIGVERRRRWEEDYLAKQHAKGKEPKSDKWKANYKQPADYDRRVLPEIPASWTLVSMDELTSLITSGSRAWSRYYGKGTGTFLMAQNVRPLRLDLSFRQAVDPPDDLDRLRSQVEEGDLLTTIVGANTGDVCRVPRPLPEHYVCQSVALMRPVIATMSEFLAFYLNSDRDGRNQWNRYIYGQGRPHLSFDQLRKTVVPLPPLAEQAELVQRVRERLATLEVLKTTTEAASSQFERLDQSVLAKAFRGELVPQDPSDEPASILLGRIRAERKVTAPQKKPRPKKVKASQTPAEGTTSARQNKAKPASNRAKDTRLLRVLDVLKRAALHRVADAEEVELSDRRTLAAARDGLLKAAVPIASAIEHLQRDELKAVCRALDLEDRGRTKAELKQRILAEVGRK